MGDTLTHEAIEQILIRMAEGYVPAADAKFLELGNWLTDYSQFRDPTAFMSGKLTVWNSARSGLVGHVPLVLKEVARLDDYLDDLFGKPGEEGSLSKWAKQVALANTLNKFCLGHGYGLSAEEAQSIFERRFTQYYPHEHVDFPPWPWDNIVGDRTASTVAAHSCSHPPNSGPTRRVCAYTEEQLVYISDLLTSVQERWKSWVATASEGSDRQPLHELLCDYSHASHAAEDFFFHSNFAELAWQTYRQGMPPDAPDIRHQRVYARRLRTPLGEGTELDTSQSLSAQVVYTGYFGAKDMSHSLTDGVRTMIDETRSNHPDAFITFLGPLLGANAQGRNQDGATGSPADTETNRKAALDRYRQSQNNGTLELALQYGVERGELHPNAADALRLANTIDLDLMNKHDRPGLGGMGIMGFVVKFLALVDEDHTAAEKIANSLDARRVTNQSLPTDNGSFDENIGSHSLISKDSIREGPLRPQAFNLAVREVTTLFTTMLEYIYATSSVSAARFHRDTTNSDTNTVDQLRGIDWLHALQHFICHPTECESRWCDAAMDDPGAESYYSPHRLERDETERRAQQPTKRALEQKYKDGEIYYQQKWMAKVTRDVLMDVGLLVAAVGIIGALVGGPVGAVIGAAVGILAAVVIAVAGAVAGLF